MQSVWQQEAQPSKGKALLRVCILTTSLLTIWRTQHNSQRQTAYRVGRGGGGEKGGGGVVASSRVGGKGGCSLCGIKCKAKYNNRCQ